MKQITDYITINEALANDVKIPRKGSTVYLLMDGETKAIPVKVTNIVKVRNPWYGSSKGYDVFIELEENEYWFNGWMTSHYGEPELDAPVQVQTHAWEVGPKLKKGSIIYVGTSKEAISEYIKSAATKKLERILKDIKELEMELLKSQKEKDKLEITLNTEITESLNL